MSSLASVVAALFLLVALNVVASAQPNAQFLFVALADQAPGPDDPFDAGKGADEPLVLPGSGGRHDDWM